MERKENTSQMENREPIREILRRKTKPRSSIDLTKKKKKKKHKP